MFRKLLFQAFEDCENNQRTASTFRALNEDAASRPLVNPPREARFVRQERNPNHNKPPRVHEMGVRGEVSEGEQGGGQRDTYDPGGSIRLDLDSLDYKRERRRKEKGNVAASEL